MKKPPESEENTILNKWSETGEDPTKIYWNLKITGQKDSDIPGSTIMDELMQGEQHYLSSDMASGLRFGAGVYNPETCEKNTVYRMLKDNRIRYFAPADYTEDSELDDLIKAIIRTTAVYEELEGKHIKDVVETREEF